MSRQHQEADLLEVGLLNDLFCGKSGAQAPPDEDPVVFEREGTTWQYRDTVLICQATLGFV
jgi:hypothetical protein